MACLFSVSVPGSRTYLLSVSSIIVIVLINIQSNQLTFHGGYCCNIVILFLKFEFFPYNVKYERGKKCWGLY